MRHGVPEIKMKQVEPNNLIIIVINYYSLAVQEMSKDLSLAVQEMSKDLSKLESSQERWVSRCEAANNHK